MKADIKNIGKRAVLTESVSWIQKDAKVIIIGLNNTLDSVYACQIIDNVGEMIGGHNCDGQLKSYDGYFIHTHRLELIEEETITYDLDNPFSGMEKFK